MKFKSFVKNIKKSDFKPGTAHSSSITDFDNFTKIIDSLEKQELPKTAHKSASANSTSLE